MTAKRREPGQRAQKVRLLDPKNWEDAPAENLTLFVPAQSQPPRSDMDHKCRCGKLMEGRRASAIWCEPKCAQLMKLYGIGMLQFDALMAAQDNRCAICKGRQTRSHLAVDHDHRTGFVRGLLCLLCNRDLLSAGRHSAARFQAAANYLTLPPAFQVIGQRKAAGA